MKKHIKFIEDGSYVLMPSYYHPAICVSGDHSAITTPHPDTLISKWNNGPLMKHLLNRNPFSTSVWKYYVRPSITGPEMLSSAGTFQLINGQSVSWSIYPSSGFSLSTSTGASTTVTAIGLNGQSGTLTATITTAQGTTQVTRSIRASTLTISGPDLIASSCSGTYTLPAGTPSGTWQVIGGDLTPASYTGTSFTVSHTANINDPANTTIQFSFTQNGQTYTANKNVVARITPVKAAGVVDLATHQAQSYV